MKEINLFDTRIVCFDFDGTITSKDNFPDVASPNVETVRFMEYCKLRGWKIVVNSSRDTIFYPEVFEYLTDNNIPFDEIHLKCKPTADLYIDDKGYIGTAREMAAFAESLFYGKDFEAELAAGNLTSPMFQNMYSTPESGIVSDTDDKFRVAIPMTGGMDSTTLWKMNQESGEPALLFYCKWKQDYADAEIETVRNIIGDRDLIVLDIDLPMEQYSHIMLGRNFIFLKRIADWMQEHGYWGEIWFGNLQGESPAWGGDKSRRFLNDFNKWLVAHAYDVRIVSPLQGMNKYDQVHYWQAKGAQELFTKTRTCFNSGDKHCGKCQACFRRYMAFFENGVDLRDQFETLDFSTYIRKYETLMTAALETGDFSKYSKSRCERTLSAINKFKERYDYENVDGRS